MTNIFEGKRVRLRAPEPSDDPIFREWDRKDTDNGRMLHEIRFPRPHWTPENASDNRLPEGDDFAFTIEALSGDVVGGIHVHCNPRNGTFLYGVSIFPDQQRKGYAYEAIWLVLRFYFHERRYQKCAAYIYSYNEASARLHERLGFTLEGRQTRMVYSGGAFHDMLSYGMTIEEFQAKYFPKQ